MKIYLARNNVQAGPYNIDELNTMLSSGEVLLDDLIWHSGMTSWQRLGDVTHNQYFYQPNMTQPTSQQRGFGDNVDFFPPNSQEQRVSVDELYGRQSSQPQTISITKMVAQPTLEFASIKARFGAFVINVGLYILAILPLIMAFTQVIDVSEINQFTSYGDLQAYAQTLANKISKTTVLMSNIMLFALLSIQLLLIILRGQSFGKMVMGIRILDQNTHKLPPFGTLVFMRTIALVLLYFLGMSILSGLPAVLMLSANYIIGNKDKQKQGWHDKMTKTIVAKAHSSQLDKTKP